MKKSSRINQFLELIILACLVGILLVSCRTVKKEIVPDPIPFHDTISTTIREHIVTVHDTLRIVLPQESREVSTRDTTSTLTTSVATSTATILGDGTLFHTLNNLPTALSRPTESKIIYRDSIVEKRVEVPVPYPVEVEVEKALTHWQQFRLTIGSFFCGLLCLLFLGATIYTGIKLWRKFR